MRKYGIPVLAVALGIGIGLLMATPRGPEAAEATRDISIAAIPGEKGGSDVFGPYDQWSFGKAGQADAHSIYMDDNRYLWVMDRTASRMVKYDLEGHFLYSWGVAGMFPGGFFGPHQTAVDQEGNFYTAEVNGGRFQKYQPRKGANPAFMIAPIRARR